MWTSSFSYFVCLHCFLAHNNSGVNITVTFIDDSTSTTICNSFCFQIAYLLVCIERLSRYVTVEESPEFLQPVDTAPPFIMERRDHGKNLEMVKTKLFGPSTAAYFTYNRVTWRLSVRKEVNIQHADMNMFDFNPFLFYGIFILLCTPI